MITKSRLAISLSASCFSPGQVRNYTPCEHPDNKLFRGLLLVQLYSRVGALPTFNAPTRSKKMITKGRLGFRFRQGVSVPKRIQNRRTDFKSRDGSSRVPAR